MVGTYGLGYGLELINTPLKLTGDISLTPEGEYSSEDLEGETRDTGYSTGNARRDLSTTINPHGYSLVTLQCELDS